MGLAVAQGYVYMAELGQLVPTVSSLGVVQGMALQGTGRPEVEQLTTVESESEVSSDEDCPVSPACTRSQASVEGTKIFC